MKAHTHYWKKIFAAAVFAVLVFFPGCIRPKALENQELVKSEKPQTSSITIIAAGDNLIHDIIYNRARVRDAETETFNFDPSYQYIKPILAEADIAIVNQETVLGGRQFGHSGYPVFNTPQDAGLGLLNAGFNVINQASNHTMDRGEGAVYGTMDFWDSQKAFYLGVFRSEEQRKNEKKIVEKNGITVGFLSYTYGLNGFPLPKDKPWLVGLIDKEVMALEIDALRPICDILLVSMHWGNEFLHTVSAAQKDLTAFLADHKVDIIIGHHPHVTEPMALISRPDGGTLTVYYSLGDFLSHTQADNTPDTMTGALAHITITKTVAKDTTTCVVSAAGVIPTVCHYNYDRNTPFVVYPLWDYTDELASKHYKKNMTVEYLNKLARNIFGPARILDKEQFERSRSGL